MEISHGSTGHRSIFGHLSRVAVKAGQLMKGEKVIDPLDFITDAVLIKDGHSVWYAQKDDLSRGKR